MPAGQLGVSTYIVPPLAIVMGLICLRRGAGAARDRRRRDLPGRASRSAGAASRRSAAARSDPRYRDAGKSARIVRWVCRRPTLYQARTIPFRAFCRVCPTLTGAVRLHTHHAVRRARTQENCGCQDPPQAARQDPCPVLPHRRRRLAHQARRSRHRRDRQVPPDRGALVHRDRLGPRAVLARRRRTADRAGRRAAEAHRRLGHLQGREGCQEHHPHQGRARAVRRRREEEAGSEAEGREAGQGRGAPSRRRVEAPVAEAPAADEAVAAPIEDDIVEAEAPPPTSCRRGRCRARGAAEPRLRRDASRPPKTRSTRPRVREPTPTRPPPTSAAEADADKA